MARKPGARDAKSTRTGGEVSLHQYGMLRNGSVAMIVYPDAVM